MIIVYYGAVVVVHVPCFTINANIVVKFKMSRSVLNSLSYYIQYLYISAFIYLCYLKKISFKIKKNSWN